MFGNIFIFGGQRRRQRTVHAVLRARLRPDSIIYDLKPASASDTPTQPPTRHRATPEINRDPNISSRKGLSQDDDDAAATHKSEDGDCGSLPERERERAVSDTCVLGFGGWGGVLKCKAAAVVVAAHDDDDDDDDIV